MWTIMNNHINLSILLPCIAVWSINKSGLVVSFQQPAFVNRSSRKSRTSASSSSSSLLSTFGYGLLFDCDGVILETENLHRLAYNRAFKEFELSIDGELVEWSTEYYDFLSNTVAGGIPKMNYHFRNKTGTYPTSKGNTPAPTTSEEQQALVEKVQKFKTQQYKMIVETEAETRPGVLALMDEALATDGVGVGVCSASTKEAALKTLEVTLGADRVSKLDVLLLGDDVSEKKPSPMIYNEARERLGLSTDQCVVIEDSMVGLRAAKAADMKCLITYTSGTKDEDFYGAGAADAVVPDLSRVTLASIFDPIREKGPNADILVGIKE